MANEPILTADDHEQWDVWMRTAREHARTSLHRRRVERSRMIVAQALDTTASWCGMTSGGKDSTVMLHLVHSIAPSIPWASEKDDLDYPGERDYVRRIADQVGAQLTILSPPFSVRQWMADHARELTLCGDLHSRSAELSKAAFYEIVESHSAKYDGVFLGIRSRESHGRAMNRARRGTLYRKNVGQWVCTPIADWDGIDVYAYAATHSLDLLDVYRCISFMHSDEPWRIRKSWWIPEGSSSRYGGVAWLRRYYPSLYRQLCEWIPGATTMA